MRTRTNFVVEYKNSRRLTKGTSSSIWGNLDLKAVARQVEVDSSLPMDAHAGVVSRPEEGPDPVSATPTSKAASDLSHDGLPNPTSEPVSIEKCGPATEPLAEKQTAILAAEDIGPKPKTIPRKGRDESRRRQAAAVTENQDTPDDLATLEAENQQLKRLMIARLRSENSLLKSMLSRFGQL
jgi:hypothetical protein